MLQGEVHCAKFQIFKVITFESWEDFFASVTLNVKLSFQLLDKKSIQNLMSPYNAALIKKS